MAKVDREVLGDNGTKCTWAIDERKVVQMHAHFTFAAASMWLGCLHGSVKTTIIHCVRRQCQAMCAFRYRTTRSKVTLNEDLRGVPYNHHVHPFVRNQFVEIAINFAPLRMFWSFLACRYILTRPNQWNCQMPDFFINSLAEACPSIRIQFVKIALCPL